MFFKIVKTFENSKIFFTAVPEKWEHDGKLYWPPEKKTMEKLRKNSTSVPQAGWIEMGCTVKGEKIKTFVEALKMEKKLCDLTDTEAEEIFDTVYPKKRAVHRREPNITDYNSIADSLEEIQNYNPPYENENENDSISIHHEGENTVVVDGAPVECEIITLNEVKNSAEIEKRLKILENENAKAQVKLDKCLDILQSLAQKILTPSSSSCNLDEGTFKFPLTTIVDIENFEASLSKPDFKGQMVTKFSQIGGNSGHDNGRTVAYKLVDVLFSREVLKNYTWTGVSKSVPKLSFSALKNLNDFFSRVVSLADNRFSVITAEDFFKNAVLKHSNVRSQFRPSPRQSAARSTRKRKLEEGGRKENEATNDKEN